MPVQILSRPEHAVILAAGSFGLSENVEVGA